VVQFSPFETGQNVFVVARDWGKVVDVNLNSAKTGMNVGDSVSTDLCTVFFQQAVLRTDGRIGFDVSCG
jgi:hypothetical protein